MSEVVVQRNVGAQMRDGTWLRANVYRPASGGPFPVLLSRQPYNKDTNINLVYFDPLTIAASGYIVVMQDVRGRYASDGDFTPGEQEYADGYDSVQWAAALPGSSGQVGMWGRSYHAETQWRAAVCQPPALKSLALGVSPLFLSVQADNLHGGVPEMFRLLWPQLLIGLDRLVRRYREDRDTLASSVTDYLATSNGLSSGELFDRLPLRSLAHEPASLMGEVIAALEAPLDAPAERGPWPAGIYERVRTDTFHIGGWYDIFTRSTLAQYQAMAAATEARRGRPPHLLIGPWTHSVYLACAGQVDFGLTASGGFLDGRSDLNREHVRWFDATLKGRDEALADTPPVRLFVMGEKRWRAYDRYPIPGARTEAWYLQPDGGLSRAVAPESEPDVYAYDPMDPVPTVGGSTMLPPIYPPGPFDQRGIEARPDVLSFTSATLAQAYTVLGDLSVTLYAASSAPDTDFVARLVDVWPDGRAINIVDGIVRASARETYSRPGEVRPTSRSLITPDTVYCYSIDLGASGITFQAGHRLRVDITSSSHPRWVRNLNTGRSAVDSAESAVARQRIFHDPRYPSHLLLTVIA